MTRLTRNTLIPLGAVIVAVPTFAGFVFWLSSMYALANNNADKIKEMRYFDPLLMERMARVETKVNMIYDLLDKKDEK